MQEIDLQLLLGRPSTPISATELRSAITGRRILVTGGGGSIGSELCRIICQYEPAKLVILESSEFALYKIKTELATQPMVTSKLESVLNIQGIKAAIADYGIDTVYHAAAYKHVPLLEENPLQAIINNIDGTRNVIAAAIAAKVETFVLVSTDKAVAPTSVMGASKRVCEMLVQATKTSTTKLCAVRFGNVLGSSGSVVPRFLQQIALGGPVTVTHPEMTRYFMAIPEACHLVIQAGAIAKPGGISLLDMGQPIKILDLAEAMIRAHGLEPGRDIEIIITGIRPGEKLHEQLHLNEAIQLCHGIYQVDAQSVPRSTAVIIEQILQLAYQGSTKAAVSLLFDLVKTEGSASVATGAIALPVPYQTSI